MGNVKFGEDRMCISGNILADRQTSIQNTETDPFITRLRPRYWRVE